MEATFAAGCFWGIEKTFANLPGVTKTETGYTGGHTLHPSYEQVCSGKTGHAEAVHLEFDPNIISFEKLLEVFWHCHDPSSVNRQGPDVGAQYRSAIFYHSKAQKLAAEKSKAALEASHRLPRKVATEIVPAPPFYRAEEYHQRYWEK